MPSPIKITGDVKPLRKSIFELGREIANLGSKAKPISIFDNKEKEFLKTIAEDLNRQFAENRKNIADMLDAQKGLVAGGKEEARIRNKITKALSKQVKLSKQIQSTKGQAGVPPGGGEGGGGSIIPGGMLTKIGLAIGAAGIAVAAKASGQFVQSSGDRVRAQGLGIPEGQHQQGDSAALARVGLTEVSLLQRRIQATAEGSLAAGSFGSVTQRAGFEREQGLEKNQLGEIIAALRPSLGGDQANDAQMKLQALVNAAGIKNAVGPYLESMVGLLANVNETGLIQTEELMKVFAGLASDGARTPEQISNTFGTINEAMKTATGEVNAFYQVAFARAGIGGKTIGGTQLALSSGGLFGMDKEELAERGYGKGLIEEFEKAGFMKGIQERGGAVLDQLKLSGGMNKNQQMGDITSLTKMIGVAQLGNSMFGTTGMGGFDASVLLEKATKGEIDEDQFKAQLKDIKEKSIRETISPDSSRLDTINDSLSGITTILRAMRATEMERLGSESVRVSNMVVDAQTLLIRDFTVGMKASREALSPGESPMGNDVKSGITNFGDFLLENVPGVRSGLGLMGIDSPGEKSPEKNENLLATKALTKSVGDLVTTLKAQSKKQPMQPEIKISVPLSDGTVQEQTTR